MKLTAMMYCAAVGVAASSLLHAQSLPSRKMLTLEVAQSLAHDAMESCRMAGYKVSVIVVDDANRPIVFIRDDGAGNATPEVARMKATTVLSFGRPSGQRPPNLPPGMPLPAPVIPGTMNREGGLPITIDQHMIGAIAVSGAAGGDKDAACARAALEKATDKLR